MDHEVLVMENVSKQYKRKMVIDQFNLRAKAGELIALAGPNGAGKSTMIQMICGILRPTTGVIRVNGRTYQTHRKAYASDISYMPDHYELSQPLTVKEFLGYYASLRRISKGRVVETLELVGLAERSRDYISTLSKGMGQRLLLAQALLSDASLILLDEPTNGLDRDWLGRLSEILTDLTAQQKTVVFTTHLDAFAEEISDRIVSIGSFD